MDALKQEVKLESVEVKEEVKQEVKERKDILKILVYKKEIRKDREKCEVENVIKLEYFFVD